LNPSDVEDSKAADANANTVDLIVVFMVYNVQRYSDRVIDRSSEAGFQVPHSEIAEIA
jgi:hypothetical protein